ncbi:MAG TPA: hypothetical protein VL974_14820 [Magnetospirillum sp.]|nr:hypothetical protein [Magnetospirillum sp.]
MDSSIVMMVVSAVVGVAAWTLTLWLLRENAPTPVPMPLPRPQDREPHTLTHLGADGRPNPAHYERFPTYQAALLRQRELTRRGRDSIITHSDSGEVRVDLSVWFGPFGRMPF